jgi:acyl-CoA thioester hydrolase
MHKTEIRVQWFDVDCAGVVYFGNYFRFFNTAEDEYMRSLGITHRELIKQYNISFTRVETTCRFIRPARYDDVIEVHTKMKLENDRFLTFQFDLFRKEGVVLLARGMIRTACVRLKDGFKAIRIPAKVFEKLNQGISDAEQL